MTIPPVVENAVRRVRDMVIGMVPKLRSSLSKEESLLGVHLRGNAPLYEALTNVLKSRIEGRANVHEPTDPLVCKSILARDGELRWLLGRLNLIYRSSANDPVDNGGEQPE